MWQKNGSFFISQELKTGFPERQPDLACSNESGCLRLLRTKQGVEKPTYPCRNQLLPCGRGGGQRAGGHQCPCAGTTERGVGWRTCGGNLIACGGELWGESMYLWGNHNTCGGARGTRFVSFHTSRDRLSEAAARLMCGKGSEDLRLFLSAVLARAGHQRDRGGTKVRCNTRASPDRVLGSRPFRCRRDPGPSSMLPRLPWTHWPAGGGGGSSFTGRGMKGSCSRSLVGRSELCRVACLVVEADLGPSSMLPPRLPWAHWPASGRTPSSFT